MSSIKGTVIHVAWMLALLGFSACGWVIIFFLARTIWQML